MSLEGPRKVGGVPENVLVVDDPRFDRHVAPASHPERPSRLAAARRALAALGGSATRVPLAPQPATLEQLARVHDAELIEGLEGLRGRTATIDADTFVSPESIDAAWLAAGSAAHLVDQLIDGPVKKGLALLRPPGHHATPTRAMGFCLLNNVAVAAAQARARGLERIAVIDWDVHHGNGTQEIFWQDPHVLYVSTHQFPFYPGTGGSNEAGEGEGKGYTVNVPLSAGGGDAIYASAFERIVLPVLGEYRPELVLVSAGFDASAADPLAQMELSAEAFGWMARELAGVAERSAGGKMALLLEGGYDLGSLESGLHRALEGMLLDKPFELSRVGATSGLDRVARAAKKAWPVVS